MSVAGAPIPAPGDVVATWARRWPEALALWSRFTRLRDPLLCETSDEAQRAGLTGSFAMIRLTDQLVVIDLEQVSARGLADLPLEILGHEIGHHILCPATLTDQGRMVARMRWALPSVESAAPAVANLYADLHINDRLQRTSGLRMDEVYRRLRAGRADDPTTDPPGDGQGGGQGDDPGPGGDLWSLYQRMYEILWALPTGDLVPGPLPGRVEGDAQLGARLVRAYRDDWLEGAAGFAALCLPYLTHDPDARAALAGWGDALDATGGTVPDGLATLDEGERDEPLHPAHDPRVSGSVAGRAPIDDEPVDVPPVGHAGGQHREPFEYGELLRALGLDLTDHEIAVRYYREAARPHLLPFPTRPVPRRGDLVPEGYEPWEIGDPISEIDWPHTVFRSPQVVPGVTTVRRVLGPDDDRPPTPEPIDLDLYIDSSGSIANPQIQLSFLALAATIIALSCLRSGGRVQATLWSGARQFETTGGFVTAPDEVLRIVTGYIGGATAFPVHILRDTYAERTERDRPVHLLVISDDGVTTMFDQDERGGDGAEIASRALVAGRAGGTMVLQLWRWPDDLDRATAMGWNVEQIANWDELLLFARRFAAQRYGADR